ncbi:alpha/beta fold hydrolase [Kitasatospora sp. LaBMicrA B282]|uniref:alpha/beta fold hydrolase n=1 Tax=Kitasatospora sp. LaBMicrA B282 TaxID=3420949 RepID=UPI003D0C188F
MTAFVLVPGIFTGGWVWQEVTERLRAAGAEVHPATLTGLGEEQRAADTGADLETHIEDLVRLIDRAPAAKLVLVGHDYGIHPVLGAADRRPERVERIVYLDAALAQDGDPALVTLPDPTVRERLLAGAALPAPTAGEWARWGSTAGLTDAALDRLAERAVPQPTGTLTQPLKLTGAVAGLPTSGVLCTGGGMTIEMLQGLVSSGHPLFKPLADPRVGFFELATGHWPMLSAPAELAEALLGAAAGEGHRLTAPAVEDWTALPFILPDLPEQPRERTGRVDLHLPAEPAAPGRRRPAVVLVHGGPLPRDQQPTPRDWPLYRGYARYLAGQGVVGVVSDQRFHSLADYPVAAADVAAVVELVRADPRVDPDRIALWFFSGGGLLAADWLAAPPSWLRCVAATYPALAPLPSWAAVGVDPRFRPVTALAGAGRLPVVLTRAALDQPEMAASQEEFLAAATDLGAAVEVVEVPGARHGFEILDPTEEVRAGLRASLAAVLRHLVD